MINCMSAAISDLIAVAVCAAGASQPCSGAPPLPTLPAPQMAPQPRVEIPAAAPSATRGGHPHPIGCSGLQEIAPGFCTGDGLLGEKIPPPPLPPTPLLLPATRIAIWLSRARVLLAGLCIQLLSGDSLPIAQPQPTAQRRPMAQPHSYRHRATGAPNPL